MSNSIKNLLKKVFISIGVVLVLCLISMCCIAGKQIWDAYHPWISIAICEGGAGKTGCKLETPCIVSAGNMVKSIESKVSIIISSHNEVIAYVSENYTSCDIKLDMEITDDTTSMNYYGTATTLDGEAVDFEKEFMFDFTLDAELKNIQR